MKLNGSLYSISTLLEKTSFFMRTHKSYIDSKVLMTWLIVLRLVIRYCVTRFLYYKKEKKMDKCKITKIINWICYALVVVEFLVFYGLKGKNFFYAKVSLQIFLVIASLLCAIPLCIKGISKKDKIRQALLILFFIIGLVSTMLFW